MAVSPISCASAEEVKPAAGREKRGLISRMPASRGAPAGQRTQGLLTVTNAVLPAQFADFSGFTPPTLEFINAQQTDLRCVTGSVSADSALLTPQGML
jgi:hypothetical protein